MITRWTLSLIATFLAVFFFLYSAFSDAPLIMKITAFFLCTFMAILTTVLTINGIRNNGSKGEKSDTNNSLGWIDPGIDAVDSDEAYICVAYINDHVSESVKVVIQNMVDVEQQAYTKEGLKALIRKCKSKRLSTVSLRRALDKWPAYTGD